MKPKSNPPQPEKSDVTIFGIYSYQDVPKAAFPYGTELISIDGYTYKIATKEKALLDQLYSASPIQNMKEMREYLFENMRINEMILDTFDKNNVLELSKLYHSRNVTLFSKMLLEEKMYD